MISGLSFKRCPPVNSKSNAIRLSAPALCIALLALSACKQETTRQGSLQEQPAGTATQASQPAAPSPNPAHAAAAKPQPLPIAPSSGGAAAEKPKPLPLPQAVKEQPAKADNFGFNACNWRALRAGATPGTASVLVPRGDFDRAQPQTQPQDCSPPSTMVMSDFTVGEGKLVEPRRAVMVHYTGWLFDPTKPDGKGAQFDSSRERPLGFSFMVGVGRVIKGWDEGVVGMKEGGRRLLIIPPNMGYGDRGGGPIPPGSTLIFDVEVLRVLQ